jgi:hypothetical protein
MTVPINFARKSATTNLHLLIKSPESAHKHFWLTLSMVLNFAAYFSEQDSALKALRRSGLIGITTRVGMRHRAGK